MSLGVPRRRSRYGVSSTFRGIYVMRWLLFSGAAAIGLGWLELQWNRGQGAGTGLGIGLACGLVLFRGQLAPLRWPVLVLRRDRLHLLHRRKDVSFPWQAVARAFATGSQLTLEFRQPLLGPDGEPTAAIQLDARRFGVDAPTWAEELTELAANASARQALPPEI